MLKKIFIPMLCFSIILSFCFISKAPVFKGYAKTFQVYKFDSASSNFLTVSELEYYFVGKIKGESFSMDSKDFNLEQFLKSFNAKVLMVEKIAHGASIYAFSPQIRYRNSIGGHTINLHIFLGGNTVTVGAPLIYGSF